MGGRGYAFESLIFSQLTSVEHFHLIRKGKGKQECNYVLKRCGSIGKKAMADCGVLYNLLPGLKYNLNSLSSLACGFVIVGFLFRQ